MTAASRSGIGWTARLMIALVLILLGAAAATWGLSRYQSAARVLGVAPAFCLALEDSASGVAAAKSAGMLCAMVPDMLPPTQEDCAGLYLLAESLFDVLALFTGEGR